MSQNGNILFKEDYATFYVEFKFVLLNSLNFYLNSTSLSIQQQQKNL